MSPPSGSGTHEFVEDPLDLFRNRLADCRYHHGDLVVDAVAGIADSQTGRTVTRKTPFFSFSAGKVTTSLIAHLLVRVGVVEYDSPVADLWPV